MKYIDTEKCPACGSELRFDVHTSKKHCQDCGRIWSFDIDFESRKLLVHEWKIVEKGTPLYDFIMQFGEYK